MKTYLLLLCFLSLAGGAARSQSGNIERPEFSGSLGIGALLAPKPSVMTEFGIMAMRKGGW